MTIQIYKVSLKYELLEWFTNTTPQNKQHRNHYKYESHNKPTNVQTFSIRGDWGNQNNLFK